MIVSDDGSGGFEGLGGYINYSTGAVWNVQVAFTVSVPTPVWTLLHEAYWFTHWGVETQSLQLDESSTISVEYQHGDALAAVTETHTLTALAIDFVEGTAEPIISGSLRFTFGEHQYIEQGGALYGDVSAATGTGISAGTLDLASRRATMTLWNAGVDNAPTVHALLTRLGNDAVPEVTIKVPAPPIKQGGLTLYATQLDGTAVSATVDNTGALLAAGIVGQVDFQMGVAWARFGDWITAAGNEGEPWYDAAAIVDGKVFRPLPVYADSILYDATMESRATLPADVIDIDTALLPASGQLEKVRARDMLYFFDDQHFNVSSPVAGASFDCSRTGLERVWVVDADGVDVPADRYTATDAELDAGILHWADPLDTTGHATPWTVWHRVSEVRTAGVVDRFGTIRLRDKPFTRAFPVGAGVSSMLYAGNLQADWSVPTFWKTWQDWNTAGTGDEPAAAYDYGNFPLVVKNNGATIKARIAFVFQDSTHFRCIVEGFGQIDSGVPITADYSPINPATGQPYFTITGNHDGNEPWGTGWAALNYMLFELSPSSFPFCAARCVQPSNPVTGVDSGRVELLGNLG